MNDPDLGLLFSPLERQRIMSSQRLKTTLSLFTTILVMLLTSLNYIFATRALDKLGESVRSDLEQKALRGPSDFLQKSDVAIVTGDPTIVRDQLTRYERDPDIAGIIVTDGSGATLASYGMVPSQVHSMFSGKANQLTETSDYFMSWSVARIGSHDVAKAAFVVSTGRLAVTRAARRQIVLVTILGCLAALALSFGFVELYLGPLVKLSEDALARLEITTASALEASMMKSEFVANMSHELRSPLNSVISFAGLLAEELEDRGLHECLPDVNKIITAGRHLTRIVGEVLDFSKIEAGRIELERERFSVRDAIREVVQVAEPFAAKNHNHLNFLDDEQEYMLTSDPQKFRQSLLNLLSNACKFTHDGEVTVCLQTVSGDHPSYRIDVQDTGIGIEPSQMKRLFQPFVQLDGSPGRKYGGTGLGLVISQRFCHMMGGQLTVQSVAGRGSTFSIVLPVKPPKEAK